MYIEYRNKERDYEEWCTAHNNGYIFNRAGGKTGNVLHSVGCWHLNVPSRKGTYTTRYPKYCAEDVNDLLAVADELSKPDSWRKFKACMNK